MSRQATSSHFHKSKTLENKYMLGDEIGKGAHARVYKGLDLENGDFVAIKQVSLENIAQEDLNIIMQEIDLLKNLNHRNIVKYLGSLKTKSHLHIILEYVENGSLANIIKPNKFGPFPESLVAVYISQVLEGLAYLHEQGVIHRDIKGANILTTKEGLVKLADFGVATKLTEADVNTHSVVGTPYWMAPEVIEMSGVCAASDIWSVGCTVIELLTCVPPYYDLQPMPALFRIVQDQHPPIPDSLSSDITDFLLQCFKKDARQRPDAKTLLSHPWIQNSRRALNSLRHNESMKIQEDKLVDSELVPGDDPSPCKSHSADTTGENSADLGTGSREDVCTNNSLRGETLEGKTIESAPHDKLYVEDSIGANNRALGSAPHCQDNGFEKNDHSRHKAAVVESVGGSLDKRQDNLLTDVSTSIPISYENQSNASVTDVMENDHRASEMIITSTHTQKANVNGISNNGGDLFRLMMGVLKENVIDIDSLVFDGKLPADNFFPLQAVEFGRLVGSLRPDESEEVIASACVRLMTVFHQRPEQKVVFITQHGLLPLVELLEIPKINIICSILQLINQVVKDNMEILENACLVGLIPVVMNFAAANRPWDVRMEAAYFVQQLCQSSSLTLQMFIACRGIPVLVGFLEADYAKYREMVHLAIDGMWQVFKLHRSTPRNDFCFIAAKNGILLRLINTLYSLNEATRLASISGGTGHAQDGSVRKSNSCDPILLPSEKLFSVANLLPDSLKGKHEISNLSPTDADKPQSSNAVLDTLFAPKFLDPAVIEKPSNGASVDSSKLVLRDDDGLDKRKNDQSVKRAASHASLTSMDGPPKFMESTLNGHMLMPAQIEQVRPLLSLLEMEPPSRNLSGQLEAVYQLCGSEKQECRLPLLHASSKKSSGELDFLMAEFAEVSGLGKENGSLDSSLVASRKLVSKKVGPLASSDNVGSKFGIASQSASGILSGSGVLSARPGCSSSGLLSHVVSSSNADIAREYLDKVADLLLEFSQAVTAVKSYMCSQSLLSRLLQMFNRVEPPILLKILKCINYLSSDPNCLENLQRADAIKYLIPNLQLRDGRLVEQIHHEVLSALFNLCKINKRRQEQAAENGIIPHLMNFIVSNSSLKQFALPLLCDMAHASRNSREQLRAHGSLDVYFSLLDDVVWSVTALDSIAVCLAHDNENHKVEQVLLRKESAQKLVNFFQCCPEQQFSHILEPFLKIITKSSRINTTLAVNGLTPLLISRLDHQDAIARLNLLKLIKAVYEHHPRPKQLIVENDLPHKLQNLIEERRDGQSSGGQVLVKQMATSLLKALHINTIL